MTPRDNGINELLGFVVFEPGLHYDKDDITFGFTARQMSLSLKAINILGAPDYLVFFFDHIHRRMMIRAGQAGMSNAIPLAKLKRKSKTFVKRYIQSNSLHAELRSLLGIGKKDIRGIIPGHLADVSEPTLIFKLDDMQERIK